MNLSTESSIDTAPARRWVVFIPMLVAIAGLFVVLAAPGIGGRQAGVDGLITGAIAQPKEAIGSH